MTCHYCGTQDIRVYTCSSRWIREACKECVDRAYPSIIWKITEQYGLDCPYGSIFIDGRENAFWPDSQQITEYYSHKDRIEKFMALPDKLLIKAPKNIRLIIL